MKKNITEMEKIRRLLKPQTVTEYGIKFALRNPNREDAEAVRTPLDSIDLDTSTAADKSAAISRIYENAVSTCVVLPDGDKLEGEDLAQLVRMLGNGSSKLVRTCMVLCGQGNLLSNPPKSSDESPFA